VTGQGQVVDAAMVDGVASLTAMLHGMLAAGLWTDRRGENLLDGAAHFYRTYATADGGFMAVGAIEPQFYRELLDALGLAAADWPQHDRSRWAEQSRRLAAVFASRTRAEWERVFDGRDACVTPVLSLAEAAKSAELGERGTFVDWDGVLQPAPAPRLSASAVIERPRSRWCGDTDQILAELGYPAGQIAGLREDETVA
jgi:alpha-methylacyl-CoA racemase